MLDNLTQRLGRVVKNLRGQARLTEDNIGEMLREVRMALLEADVALPVVKDFIAKVKEKALGQEVIGSLTPGPGPGRSCPSRIDRVDGRLPAAG
jgi:signal recognition particle subunit SRP54